jgi:hypothetical protein
VALAVGIAGGLARLTPLPVSIIALALHGPLMVSGFFGTVISLERASELDRRWAYGAPLCAGLGGILLVAGFPREGFAAMVLAALVLLAAGIGLLKKQPSLEVATLVAGAAAWLMGNLGLILGYPAVPWWIAFFALTIGAERLERSRDLERPRWVRNAFMALAAALLFAPLEPPLLGVALVLLALWLFAFDPARGKLRQAKLPRYVALCLLAGYFWLGLGGALIALEAAYDAALHAIFVGFVFSALPALLRTARVYHPVLYLPLAVLHASLAVRVVVSTPIGGWGNALAIALFIVCAAALALQDRFRRAQTRS